MRNLNENIKGKNDDQPAKTQTHPHRGLRLFLPRGIFHYGLHRKQRENLLERRRGELCSPANVPLSNIGIIVDNEIKKLNSVYDAVWVDKYCIMPDHIHLILTIDTDKDGRTQFAPTISRVIKQFKGSITKQVGRPIWQKSFYDHGIRNQQDYDEIWQYIENNPLKYALNRTP